MGRATHSVHSRKAPARTTTHTPLVPAKAGTQKRKRWTPACAGVSGEMGRAIILRSFPQSPGTHGHAHSARPRESGDPEAKALDPRLRGGERGNGSRQHTPLLPAKLRHAQPRTLRSSPRKRESTSQFNTSRALYRALQSFQRFGDLRLAAKRL